MAGYFFEKPEGIVIEENNQANQQAPAVLTFFNGTVLGDEKLELSASAVLALGRENKQIYIQSNFQGNIFRVKYEYEPTTWGADQCFFAEGWKLLAQGCGLADMDECAFFQHPFDKQTMLMAVKKTLE